MPAPARKKPLTGSAESRGAAATPSTVLTGFLLGPTDTVHEQRPSSPALLLPVTRGQDSTALWVIGLPRLCSQWFYRIPGLTGASLHLLSSAGNTLQPRHSPVLTNHVAAANLQVQPLLPLQGAQPLCNGDSSHQPLYHLTSVLAQHTPVSPPLPPDRVNPLQSDPAALHLDSAFSSAPTSLATSLCVASMPPKSQRPPTSQRKQSATPISKRPPWSDPSEEDKVSTPPSAQ